MQKHLGKEFIDARQRESFLKDNCDKVEEKGYMKPYTPEELQGHKEELANISIDLDAQEEHMKGVVSGFKAKLKILKDERKKYVKNIRQKAEFVNEVCFKFVDQEARETGFYNSEGDLIECRPSTADELQNTIFTQLRATGTHDN